jgi:Arc-like DNA binding domain
MARRKYTSPSDELQQSLVRWPKGLREKIADRAEMNSRSINAEIVALVSAALAHDFPDVIYFDADSTPEEMIGQLAEATAFMAKRLRTR